jgi:hypothetical protein
MNDKRIKSSLDRHLPPLAGAGTWDDVLERAGRIRSRRRRLTALLAVAATGLALAGSLAAAGKLGALLPHSNEPHLLLRGDLRVADGTPVGTIEIELHRAVLAFGQRVELLPSRGQPAPQHLPEAAFPARWFLELNGFEDDLVSGVLYIHRADLEQAKATAILCSPCRAHDSGRIELSWNQASALVNGQVSFAGNAERDESVAAGSIDLDRSHLRRGLQCEKTAPGRLRCTRIYTGRS